MLERLVPRHYRLDYAQLDWLVAAGHEIGLHGIWNTNREAFQPRDEFRHELDGLARSARTVCDFGRIEVRRGTARRRCSDALADYFDADLTTPRH